MEEMNSRDAVINAEEALLDAIEIYKVGQSEAMHQGVLRVSDEVVLFPSSVSDKAQRLRQIIYIFEGLGRDYLVGIDRASMQAEKESLGVQVLTDEELRGPLPARDEYVIAQEDLLGTIEDYALTAWRGDYSEITRKAQNLREAVALHEGLGEDYLNKSTESLRGGLDA